MGLVTHRYRVVRRLNDHGIEIFGVHDAFYDRNGNLAEISEKPVLPLSECDNLKDLMTDIRCFWKAFDEPVLTYGDVPVKPNTG